MLLKKQEGGEHEREKSESKMTFEEKMEHRAMTEADRQAVLQLNGGEFNQAGKMSLTKYRKINPLATKQNMLISKSSEAHELALFKKVSAEKEKGITIKN